MWRVQGIFGRAVLHRWHANASLRLQQGPYREDEVINSSSILQTNFHSSDHRYREDGEERRRRRTSQFYYSGLPRYTALDAVGWGAAAVLFMQICRRIHSQFSSSVGDQNPRPSQPREPGPICRCGYQIILEILSKQNDLTRHVLPGALPVNRQRGSSDTSNQSEVSPSSSSDSSFSTHSASTDQQGAILRHDSSPSEEQIPDATHLDFQAKLEKQKEKSKQDPLSLDEKLTEAAVNLQHVTDTSTPVILNIIGLESAKVGDYETAFACFLASAHQRYSKAQFNVGVCYEKGRGVQKNDRKALRYYRRAAASGHKQAQYRCAKLLLLSSRGQQSVEDVDTAMDLLQKAATAGLTEAQLYLGMVLYQKQEGDNGKAAQYFRMAAQSGDTMGQLYLGQCYENGIGVNRSLNTAASLYRQAASAGNLQAKGLLTALYNSHEEQVLRSIRSAPTLSALDELTLGSVLSDVFKEAGPVHGQISDWPVQPPLPHSWSTGSLRVPPTHLCPLTSSADNAASKWTIGVG